ncbi:Ankyrin repeat protein, partial [Globisporangium splendens]
MGVLGDVPPLHVAIWEGNVDAARRILQDASSADNNSNGSSNDALAMSPLKCVLETKDKNGNSALHLAVRLAQPAQRAIVQLLLEYDASVTSRNTDGWSCVHDTTLCDDEFLLAQVFLRGEKQLWDLVQARQESFFRALENLPDFEAEIFLEAHSWVPMVSKILPSDTIRIWKRGSQLRCDTELKGLDGVKWKRGKMSHMFMGRHSERPGHAVIVDHEGETFYDVSAALRNSTVTNMDLGLQVLLTTPLSSSSMDTSKMTFRKRKDVTTIKQKKRGFCPWTGTKYRMENFTVSAQFRPVVKSQRKLKEVLDDPKNEGSVPLQEIQKFVDHISIHSSKATKKKKKKQKSMRNTNFDSDDDLKELERERTNSLEPNDPRRRSSTLGSTSMEENGGKRSSTDSANDSQTSLKLPKGKKVEMHLDVCAGDTIKWNFISKSRDFCFTATYFYDDQKLPVCKTDGVKNIAVAGAFEADFNGSFVLMWLNTQKNFSLDMNGIKIMYDVAHIRPAVGLPAPSNAGGRIGGERRLSTTVEEQDNDDDDEGKGNQTDSVFDEVMNEPSDAEKCQEFLRLDHIPNPLTVTTSFHDYFGGPSQEPSASAGDEKMSASAKMSSLFKLSKPQKKRHNSHAADQNENDAIASSGQRNTFRSLTVLPETRRLSKEFEAKVLMADKFPFELNDFLPVIQFLSHTGEHVQNLEDFFQMVRT